MEYLDNQALCFLNSQDKLNKKSMKWVECLEYYTFNIKLKKGLKNKVVDAISRTLLTMQEVQLPNIGVDTFKDLYDDDEDFTNIYKVCKEYRNKFDGEFSYYTLKTIYFLRVVNYVFLGYQ